MANRTFDPQKAEKLIKALHTRVLRLPTVVIC